MYGALTYGRLIQNALCKGVVPAWVSCRGDMIAALGLRYGTEEATDFSEKVHRSLALAAYRSSVSMAKERGAFSIFDAR